MLESAEEEKMFFYWRSAIIAKDGTDLYFRDKSWDKISDWKSESSFKGASDKKVHMCIEKKNEEGRRETSGRTLKRQKQS